MNGCHGQAFLVISYSQGAFLCLQRVKTMVTEKLASAWVTVSVPRQLVDWLMDDDECCLKEQKAVFPFWSHSNLDNIDQQSDVSKFNVYTISKYANNDQNHRPPGLTYTNKCQSNSNIRKILFHLHRCHKSQLMKWHWREHGYANSS